MAPKSKGDTNLLTKSNEALDTLSKLLDTVHSISSLTLSTVNGTTNPTFTDDLDVDTIQTAKENYDTHLTNLRAQVGGLESMGEGSEDKEASEQDQRVRRSLLEEAARNQQVIEEMLDQAYSLSFQLDLLTSVSTD